MHNKKGMTIVELLLSIVLISLVLVFIMQLCLRARNAYLNNSKNVKYELSKSIIINAVMDDYINRGISNIVKTDNSLVFTYADNTVKILLVEHLDDTILIKYSGGDDATIGREYDVDEIDYNFITEKNISSTTNSLTEYKIVLNGKDGYNYSINIYCPR